jgi:protein-disulfide isomerase
MRTLVTVAAGVVGTLVLAGPIRAAETSRPAESAGKPLALVGGAPITEAEVDRAAEGPLRELRMREFTLRSQALEELIAQKLLEKEAAARGVALPALVKAEVEDKAPVSEAEVRALYQSNKDRMGAMAEADALKQIESRLRPQRERERRAAYVRELRQKAGVKVLLEPLRVAVDVTGRPIRGNKDAPVTIVEFSDFQCPFCSRARPAVNKVRETYGDKVRIIFRNFPLSIHPQAQKAGEAANCAGEQGKFWEMHDRLFANQAKLQLPDLKEHAAALGLDAEAFGQCLDSSRHTTDLQRDAEAGTGYGVSGTPSFFINGRPLVGAQPFESFAQVIDDELERVAPAK